MSFELSQEEYVEHTENYDGICLNCSKWTYGGVEPDAEGYDCEDCGEADVCGAETALLTDQLVIEEEDDEEEYDEESIF